MRTGVRLALDVGRARIGVARSDEAGILAVPLETVTRTWSRQHPELDGDFVRIVELDFRWNPLEWVVGLPISLGGGLTASAHDAVDFATELQRRVGTPVRMVDERLSTVTASRSLRQVGISAKQSRAVVDQAAAVILLELALDAERKGNAVGRPPTEIEGYS